MSTKREELEQELKRVHDLQLKAAQNEDFLNALKYKRKVQELKGQLEELAESESINSNTEGKDAIYELETRLSELDQLRSNAISNDDFDLASEYNEQIETIIEEIKVLQDTIPLDTSNPSTRTILSPTPKTSTFETEDVSKKQLMADLRTAQQNLEELTSQRNNLDIKFQSISKAIEDIKQDLINVKITQGDISNALDEKEAEAISTPNPTQEQPPTPSHPSNYHYQSLPSGPPPSHHYQPLPNGPPNNFNPPTGNVKQSPFLNQSKSAPPSPSASINTRGIEIKKPFPPPAFNKPPPSNSNTFPTQNRDTPKVSPPIPYIRKPTIPPKGPNVSMPTESNVAPISFNTTNVNSRTQNNPSSSPPSNSPPQPPLEKKNFSNSYIIQPNKNVQSLSPFPLPPGWEARQDAKGILYWIDHNHKISTYKGSFFFF